MAGDWTALGELVAGATIGEASAAGRAAIDRSIRASLLCVLFGAEREAWVWPFPRQARQDEAAGHGGTKVDPAAAMLADLMSPLGGIGELGTLAGAADLDPMDPGPGHTPLAATLAACIAVRLRAGGTPADADDEIASSVLAGVEAAWKFRSALTGTRPGVGFHSPGVYGTLAGAAAGARALRLAPAACVDALAIGLTRAAGLAINSAASMIGLTHFGWGALHGLEAALLASQGWGASQDFGRGLATLFGEGNVDVGRLTAPGTPAADALVFKRYPCNIYLNSMVSLLEEVVGDAPVDRIEARLPWVPHLDTPMPRDLRQARNSAQAAAAIAGAGDLSYAAFSGPPGAWVPAPGVARLLPQVALQMDRDAPTSLKAAVVAVRAWRGGSLVLDAQRPMRDLGPWGRERAARLIGRGDGDEGLRALYDGGYLQAFGYVDALRRAAL